MFALIVAVSLAPAALVSRSVLLGGVSLLACAAGALLGPRLVDSPARPALIALFVGAVALAYGAALLTVDGSMADYGRSVLALGGALVVSAIVLRLASVRRTSSNSQ